MSGWRESSRLLAAGLLLIVLLVLASTARAEGPPCTGAIWDLRVSVSRLYIGCGSLVWSQNEDASWKPETATDGLADTFIVYNHLLRIAPAGDLLDWQARVNGVWITHHWDIYGAHVYDRNRSPWPFRWGSPTTRTAVFSTDNGATWRVFNLPLDSAARLTGYANYGYVAPYLTYGFIGGADVLAADTQALDFLYFDPLSVNWLRRDGADFVRLSIPGDVRAAAGYRDELYAIRENAAVKVGVDGIVHALNVRHCPYAADLAAFLTGIYVLCNQLLDDGRWRVSAHVDCGYQDWLEVDVQYQAQPASAFALAASGRGLVMHYALGDSVIRRDLPYFAACR